MCMFCRSLFVLFLLAIVLFGLLRFTDSDYPFGILDLQILILWYLQTLLEMMILIMDQMILSINRIYYQM